MRPDSRLSKRITNLSLAGLATIGLYLTAASLYNGPRISTSAWLALGRKPLTASTMRWVDATVYVPRTYPSLPNAAPWRKPVASFTLKGHDGIDGCWRVRLILDTPRRQSEHLWLLRGPTCQPDPGAPPPIQVPPGLTQE